MRRRVIAGVLAVVLAAAGTFVLVQYVRGAEERAFAGQETVEVLVASEAIEEGTPAEEIGDLVESRQITANARAEGSVADLENLKGKVAAIDIVPGEQLVSERFVDPATFETAGQVAVPEGMQVVSVELSPERAVGGQIVPGDTVGVVISFDDGGESEGEEGPGASEDGPTSHLVLHKVVVTNVQGPPIPENEQDETRDGTPNGNQVVSFAVDASDAERVVFAAEHGSIWLTSEPEGATEDGTQVQRLERIYE